MAAEPEAMDIDQAEQQEEVEKKPKGKTVKKVEAKVGGKRFEIKKWNAVAMWSWAISTDTCAICRNNLYEPSIEYQVKILLLVSAERIDVSLNKLFTPCICKPYMVAICRNMVYEGVHGALSKPTCSYDFLPQCRPD